MDARINPDMTRWFRYPIAAEAAVASRPPQPHKLRLLLAVADAIDRTGPVVGDEDGAILVEQDIGGTAEIALVTLDPAGGEDSCLAFLPSGLAVIFTMRPPWYLCRFQEPCSAIRIAFLYSAGNWLPV